MGGGGKLMAFVQGQLITASELNAINSPLYIEYYHDGDVGWTYWPSSSGVYLRNASTQMYYNWYNGAFGGGEWHLQKLVNGSWVDQASGDYGWYTNVSGTITAKGEGWYRIYYEKFAQVTFRLYWSKYPNTVGSYLRYFNDYNSSGYDTSGTKLTAAILNSGRVGTIL